MFFDYGWGEMKLHKKNLVSGSRNTHIREGAIQMFIYHHQSITVFQSTYNGKSRNFWDTSLIPRHFHNGQIGVCEVAVILRVKNMLFPAVFERLEYNFIA